MMRAEQSADSGARWIGAVGENMILFCDEELATEGNEGIYVQPVSSNRFEKIQELGGDDKVAYQVWHYVCSQEAFFFVCETYGKTGEEEKTVIKVWKPGMGRAHTCLTDEDVVKALEKSASYAAGPDITLEDIRYCEWDVWLDQTHLYIQLSDIGEEDVWLACDGTDEINLQVLDEAPEFLEDDND